MAKTRGKKMLTGFLIFILIGGGLLGAGVRYYLRRTDNAKQTFANFISTHPESVGIAAYTVDNNGAYVEDGHALFHNARGVFSRLPHKE